jgi:hypothetical protein
MIAEEPQDSFRWFWPYVMLALLLTSAFPLYQLISTGGWLFYTNGIDEAAYLSYPYAVMLHSWQGLLRASNGLIIFLHESGVSAGYVNLLFDCVGTAIILCAMPGIFANLGFQTGAARRCALLVFLLPLEVTPFNPVLALLAEWWRSSSFFAFTAMPPNSESLFLRSPEPQISWILVVVACRFFTRSQMLPWILVCVVPLVYSFIGIPLLFSVLVLIIPSKISLAFRIAASALLVAIAEKIFLDYAVDPILHRFVMHSREPVLSLTALLSSALFLGIRRFVQPGLRSVLVVLVFSLWIVPNLQIVSGVLLPASKFEEYWGVVVVAFLGALTVYYRSAQPNRWVAVAFLWSATWFWANFQFNAGILAKLGNPIQTIDTLQEASERVASSDLLLSAYLDMVHPKQPHTLFSFTKTYRLSDDSNYTEYRCAKELVGKLHPDKYGMFAHEFAVLDIGYVFRGIDEIITMRRRSLEEFKVKSNDESTPCPVLKPIFIDLD